MPNRIAIVGSRSRNCQAEVEAYVDQLPLDTIVVSGGARGVDTWAEQRAIQRGMMVQIDRVRSKELQGLAYYQVVQKHHDRNRRLVEAADRVVCFPSDPARPDKGGTGNTRMWAIKFGKPVEVY